MSTWGVPAFWRCLPVDEAMFCIYLFDVILTVHPMLLLFSGVEYCNPFPKLLKFLKTSHPRMKITVPQMRKVKTKMVMVSGQMSSGETM